MAKPDKHTGISRKVYTTEFKGEYESLRLGNGNNWGRYLKKYDVYNHQEKEAGKGNKKTVYVQLTGFKDHPYNQSIKSDIKKQVLSKPCVVLNTMSRIQCDHKDGFKKFDTLPENQNKDLFQPMHQVVNTAKREHCKKCRETRIRFNAKVLGYKKSQWKGHKRYEGSCEGCYWHDPFRFNQESSK